MARVLIAGCGDVGSAAGRRLAARGHTVFGARRDVARLPHGIEPVSVDLLAAADEALARALPPDLDAVVWALAPGARDAAIYRSAYVAGPRRLLDVLASRGDAIARAVLVSSTSVWGIDDGRVVDESTPTAPADFRGEAVVAGEREFAAGPVASTVALRFGGIYGPGRDRLLRSIERGELGLPTAPRFGNRIHRDDGAAAIEHVLSLAEPAACYVVVDDDPADLRDVYAWLAERLGAGPLPAAAGAPAGRGGSKRCSNALLRSTGWAPRYASFRDGYTALIDARG